MKKKGLIISTIVMVVVLIASLTTATYAWFTTSAVTKLEQFNVSVASNNAVKIGMRKTNTIGTATTMTEADFVSGTCTYGFSGTAGAYEAAGTWGGTVNGLSASVNGQFSWGAQSKAVAAYTGSVATIAEQVAAGDYADIGNALNASNLVSINAANGDDTTLTSVTAAKANGTTATATAFAADYIHFVLGVSPTKALDANQLVIMLDWSGSETNTLGILAALHVSYRTRFNNGTVSTWTDVQLLKDAKDSGNSNAAPTYATLAENVATNIVDGSTAGDPLYATTCLATFSDYGSSVPAKSFGLIIDGFSKTVSQIDQIELMIYLDGNDPNCVQAGTGASGRINIFFTTDVKAA